MNAQRKAVEQFTRWMFTDVIVALARTLHEEEFSIAQVALMHLLDREPTSSKEAGERLGTAAPAMSRLVEDLVERGLITRTEADHDRRVRTLALTAPGHRFVDRVSEARLSQILATVQSVPDRLRQAVMAAMQAFVDSPSHRKGGKS